MSIYKCTKGSFSVYHLHEETAKKRGQRILKKLRVYYEEGDKSG